MSLFALPIAQENAHWLDQLIFRFTRLFPEWSFFNLDYNVRGLLAVLLASLVCGAVGSLVVGNRMAFFSDALAHCAFAGIALGLSLALLAALPKSQFWALVMPIMIAFGILVGVGIAYVRETTQLASDTVIGVFFAGGLGLAAVLKQVMQDRAFFTMEDFLFGNPLTVQASDLIWLLLLAIVTAAVLAWLYNRLVFTSFNASLARSRQVPVRLCNYVFIILLALIVNICFRTVGVLLINAFLIVPAATVGNVARNMRQMFWGTLLLCPAISAFGTWLSWISDRFDLRSPTNPGKTIQFGVGGTMIVTAVVLFFLSMLIAPLWQRLSRRPQPEAIRPSDAKV